MKILNQRKKCFGKDDATNHKHSNNGVGLKNKWFVI